MGKLHFLYFWSNFTCHKQQQKKNITIAVDNNNYKEKIW